MSAASCCTPSQSFPEVSYCLFNQILQTGLFQTGYQNFLQIFHVLNLLSSVDNVAVKLPRWNSTGFKSGLLGGQFCFLVQDVWCVISSQKVDCFACLTGTLFKTNRLLVANSVPVRHPTEAFVREQSLFQNMFSARPLLQSAFIMYAYTSPRCG